ncbi:MAG: 2-hydroxyacid dehydrogenase [Anaerolineae bacterium]
MKFLIAGDLFMKSEIFQKEIERSLDGVVESLSFKSMEADWPVQPWDRGREVDEFSGSEDEIRALAVDADGIITHLGPITARVIEAARELKIIACSRGNPVNVNTEVATERGIPVIHTPGRNALAVAEFTLGLILVGLKNIFQAHTYLKRGIWRGDFYCYDKAARELSDQTVGLIGFGHVGRLTASLLKGLGAKLLVYDPYVPAEQIESLGAEKVNLETLLKRSDIVSLHAKATPETEGMIGAAELALMKPTAYLINTARGSLVDQEALCEALKHNRIAGAALDAFAKEPIPLDDPLLQLENVIITPHIAGSSRQVAWRAARMIAEDIRNFFTGEPMKYCFNSEDLRARLHRQLGE